MLVTMAQSFVLKRVLDAFSAPTWRGTVDVHSFVPGDGSLRPAYLIGFTAPGAALAQTHQDAHVQLHGDLVQDTLSYTNSVVWWIASPEYVGSIATTCGKAQERDQERRLAANGLQTVISGGKSAQ